MKIGIVKEIKPNEFRVATDPDGVAELMAIGNEVYLETGAGVGSGYSDKEYEEKGAIIVNTEEVWGKSELIYKVKEIRTEEFKFMREGLIVYTYLHSNAHEDMTDVMLENKVIGIAYEDVDDVNGEFPMLKPMSQLAGKGGFLAALHFSQAVKGGNGLILNQIVGMETPEITIIGAGHAGMGAAELAAAFGCKVNILDVSLEKLEIAKDKFSSNVETLFSTRVNLENCLKKSDVLINCILWPKTRTDHLVNREDLKLMKKNSLIVDVSCDDEGCIETSKSTTHAEPTYVVDGITHYVVDNIPSAFSRTATKMLSNSTMPYLKEITKKGLNEALKDNKYLRRGLSFYYGKLTLEETAKKQGKQFTSPDDIVKNF